MTYRMKPPIPHTRPRIRDYSRLERYRATTLHPGNWGTLLGDSTPLGSPVEVEAFEGCHE